MEEIENLNIKQLLAAYGKAQKIISQHSYVIEDMIEELFGVRMLGDNYIENESIEFELDLNDFVSMSFDDFEQLVEYCKDKDQEEFTIEDYNKIDFYRNELAKKEVHEQEEVRKKLEALENLKHLEEKHERELYERLKEKYES